MTIGEKIKLSRKKAGFTREDLAVAVDLSPAAISKVENNMLKGGPKSLLVKQIAGVLGDTSILFHYLQEDPVYQELVPQVFPILNNAKTDISAILTKMDEEFGEAGEATRILSKIFSHAEPETATPNFREVLLANLEQVIDPLRAAEFLFVHMIAQGVLSEHDRKEIHVRQQQKCIEKGHHKLQANEGEG